MTTPSPARISADRPDSVSDADAGRMTSVSELHFLGLGGTDEVGASSYLYLLNKSFQALGGWRSRRPPGE